MNKTYVVTWQAVVELNETTPEADAAWAVYKAEESIRAVLQHPETGDNYFEIREMSNGPANSTHMTLAEARSVIRDLYKVPNLPIRTTGRRISRNPRSR